MESARVMSVSPTTRGDGGRARCQRLDCDVTSDRRVTAALDEPQAGPRPKARPRAETSVGVVNVLVEQDGSFMTEINGGEATGFADLGLAPELCRALSGLGYEEPTPVQLAAIPPLLEGRDLVGQAATGTGKTAAFALPILQRILAEGGQTDPLALVLVLVPTRELAIQVAEAMRSYSRGMGARV